jgi:uncharacterized protein with HEPN domain
MRRERLLLDEMIGAVERIVELVNDRTQDQIAADRTGRDAVLWNYTVLGEAASQLTSEFTEQHPGVEWRRPTQLRNRIVHGYWSIDLSILVHNAHEQLPEFLAQLRAVRDAVGEEPTPGRTTD